MPVSLVSSGVTFPDNTTQTTAASAVTAGNGISVSSGTVAVACPTFNTVGSYATVCANSALNASFNISSGSNYSAGTSGSSLSTWVLARDQCGNFGEYTQTNNLSGTWKWMGGNASTGLTNIRPYAIACRVS